MLNKKLIAGSCLAIAMLAGSSAWATSHDGYVAAVCPSGIVSTDLQILVLCTTRLGENTKLEKSNLKSGQSYWMLPTEHNDCPANSYNAQSTYTNPTAGTPRYLVEIGNQALPGINSNKLPTACTIYQHQTL